VRDEVDDQFEVVGDSEALPDALFDALAALLLDAVEREASVPREQGKHEANGKQHKTREEQDSQNGTSPVSGDGTSAKAARRHPAVA
jgi:hypothetical protein